MSEVNNQSSAASRTAGVTGQIALWKRDHFSDFELKPHLFSSRNDARMYRAIQILGLIAVLLSGLTACSKQPNIKVSPKHPDQVLFERARAAVQQKRFTVANLTLQTLVNTYPNSEYSERARLALPDPQIAKCGQWATPPLQCDILDGPPPDRSGRN